MYVFAHSDNLCRKSTEGTDFWFGFMESRNYNPNHFIEITVTESENTGKYRVIVFDKYRCPILYTFGLTVFPVPKVEILCDQLIYGIDSTKLTVSITGTANSIRNFAGSFSWMANKPELIISDKKRNSANIKVLDWKWVQRNPYAKFEVDYQIALIDNAEISFINYSERAQDYFWDFGDSLTSIEFEPRHTYTELGDYHSTSNPWNGTVKNGEIAPVRNYVWVAKYFDIQGLELKEKGQVLLIR
jgi:PKD repeat protein